jgi:tagaturonate reductase
MKMRNLPLMLKQYAKSGKVPEHMALGFAAYLLFMRSVQGANGQYCGESNGKRYVVQDDMAARFANAWADNNINNFVDAVLSDKDLWEEDLCQLDGFNERINDNLQLLTRQGVLATLAGQKLKTVS